MGWPNVTLLSMKKSSLKHINTMNKTYGGPGAPTYKNKFSKHFKQTPVVCKQCANTQMTCLLKEAHGASCWQYFALGYIIYVKVAYSGIFLGLLYYLGVQGCCIYRASSPLPHLLSQPILCFVLTPPCPGGIDGS